MYQMQDNEAVLTLESIPGKLKTGAVTALAARYSPPVTDDWLQPGRAQQ